MLLILTILATFPTQEAEDWYTLLQRSYQLGCSADFLLSGENDKGLLIEDLPFVSIGSLPALPWTQAITSDPLQSGLWGGGRWNTSISERTFQDSLSVSKIGLIQNTMDHSRYIFQLDRPLPFRTSGNFQMLRDDSLSIFSAVLKRQSFLMRTVSWEGNNYGWGSWANWSSSHSYARIGFSRLSAGDRRPEILAGIRSSAGSLDLDLGIAATNVDSVIKGRGVAGVSTHSGSTKISGYFEYNDYGEAFWGGVTHSLGEMEFSAGVSKPVDGDMFEMLAVRHPQFNLVGRFSDETSLAADLMLEQGILRGKGAACWHFENDSLTVSNWFLLGHDWYRGRFELGPRFTAGLDSTATWNESIDILIGFTLAPFSFGAAIEDIASDADRSWSFGITWVFKDQPPLAPDEGIEER